VEADGEVLVAVRPGHARSGGAGALADGVDPDSLVAGGGAEMLREAVDRAQGGIEFFTFEVWGKARASSDARARALEDAARLVAKIANPIKRDLIVGTLATGLQVDVAVVRNALTRAANPSAGHPHASNAGSRHPMQGGQTAHGGQGGQFAAGTAGQHSRNGVHPNAPSSLREDAAPATDASVAPPPMEELELVALLADHPALIATAEADKAFWLLTDGRLRDMYSAARDGRSFLELAPVRLPPNTAKHVLSGKYALAKDPPSSLAAMTRNLEARKLGVGLAELKNRLADAKRRGDHDLARRLAQCAVAERRGDHELATQLAEQSELETSNRKQVE
jgi:DNA primase